MGFKKIFWLFIDAIFPPRCVGCKTYLRRKDGREVVLCSFCEKSIDINSGLFCSVCKKRQPEGKKICHKSSVFLLGAPAMYANPAMRGIIYSLKYEHNLAVKKILESILEKYVITLRHIFNKECLIIPVPLHRRKEKERGFNQAELIAMILKEKIQALGGDAEIKNALRRVRETRPQSELASPEERKKNVAAVFKLKNSMRFDLIELVILVDDVFTSGATMNEAARILKDAGVKSVIGFVIALA